MIKKIIISKHIIRGVNKLENETVLIEIHQYEYSFDFFLYFIVLGSKQASGLSNGKRCQWTFANLLMLHE